MKKLIGVFFVFLLLAGYFAFDSFYPTRFDFSFDRRVNNDGAGEAAHQASLRLAWLPGATFVGDVVALQKGFWRDNDLDMKIAPGGFEFDAIKLVASGKDTFGITSGPQLLQARANGAPLVAIGCIIPKSPIGWVSKKDSGISTPHDFIGKKIGSQLGTHTEITFDALMAHLGIPLSSVERIAVKFDPKPFAVGAIDVLPVYLIDQPIDLDKQGIPTNKIDPWIYDVGLWYGNVYFTHERTIRDRPELVRRFLAAASRGWEWAYSNREAATDELTTYATGLDTDVTRKKIDATFAFITNGVDDYAGVMPFKEDRWEATAELLRKYGEYKGSSDVGEAFTNEFLPDH